MADAVLSPESIQKLKVTDLKKELKERGLPVSGSKAELVERLLKGLHDTSGGGEQDVSLGEENISLEEHEDLVLKEEKKSDEPSEPPKKKIALIAPVKMPPKPVTSPAEPSKVKTEMTEAERIKKRAERFGAQSEKSKLQMRAERFGITMNNTSSSSAAKPGKIVPTAVTVEDLDKLKKRAERFGINVSTTLSKLEEDERIRKRKERFGAMVTSTNTVSLSDMDEKKRKRAERFGLQ